VERDAGGVQAIPAREAEVYAGFMEYTDYHVGRMLDGLKKLGILEDTLIYYIIGDNGASAEGGINGCFNEMSYFNGLQGFETPEYLSARLDKLGGPESYNHYAVGWAHAMNTPYQWTKQVASHWGGTRNGTIVHWPKGIKAKGEIRSQFSHVIDVAPTVLEVAGIPQPISVDGIQQDPIEGTSMLYAFNDPKAADQHETQYFEMFGNRGIYHKGWTAVTKHRTPWAPLTQKPPAFDDDVWELYDTTKDWSQSKDLSKENPQKLHELQRLWLIEAARYKVLPLDDRLMEKMNPDTAGRPILIKGKNQMLFGGMGRLSENCLLNLKKQVPLRHRRDRGAGEGRRGCHHLPRRQHRRLEPVRQGRQAQVLLQLGGSQALSSSVPRRQSRPASTRCAWSSPMRRRPGQGRQGDALHRRQEGWRGRHRGHAGERLLRRRRLRRRRGQRSAGFAGVQAG